MVQLASRRHPAEQKRRRRVMPIQTDGTVSVQQMLGDPFSNAQCFTSLDGVSFAP